MKEVSEYIMTVRKGVIVLVFRAFPPDEPAPDQIAITQKEYRILRSVDDIEELESILKSLKAKVQKVSKRRGKS